MSAKSSSSTSGRSAASFTQNGDLNGLVDYDEDQDVKFINVDTTNDEKEIPIIPPKQIRDIVPEEIVSAISNLFRIFRLTSINLFRIFLPFI